MSIQHFTAGALAALALISTSAFAGSGAGLKQQGVASYYSDRFHGRKTASGDRYDKSAMTGAHRSLPLGSKVRVTNLGNGKSVVIEINDRGPWAGKRLLDMSRRAAQDLGMISSGVAKVQLEMVDEDGGS